MFSHPTTTIAHVVLSDVQTFGNSIGFAWGIKGSFFFSLGRFLD